MELYTYVIIGGGLAGQRAADGIRKVDPDGSIALVMDEPQLPYERPALSKGYLAGKEGLDHVIIKGEDYYVENQIEVLQGARAAKLDPTARQVTLDDGRALGYKTLLLATGGRAWRLPIPGADLNGVFTLRTIENAQSIQNAAEAGKQAVVVGGSFIGSEVASSLAQLGLSVTMVFPESRLLARVVPDELSAFLHAKYAANNVRMLTGTEPECIEGSGKAERVALTRGDALDANLVVMGVGIRLNTELAREAGLEIGAQGAVVVDQYLRTSAPGIYAAGDIANWPDPTFGKRLRVEHWDVARRHGIRAGRNMAGEEKPYTALPYFFSDLFDLASRYGAISRPGTRQSYEAASTAAALPSTTLMRARWSECWRQDGPKTSASRCRPW
jgi:NAD(P)H-nitrite reductase large subunit